MPLPLVCGCPPLSKLYYTEATLDKSLLETSFLKVSFPLSPYSPTHSAMVNPQCCFALPSVIVGGGHQEDVTIIVDPFAGLGSSEALHPFP